MAQNEVLRDLYARYYPLENAMTHLGSSWNRVGNIWYYPDVLVLVHVNVNVPETCVTQPEGIALKAWRQSW